MYCNLFFNEQWLKRQKNPSQSYPFFSRKMMESWEHAARNILAHFHFICRGHLALENWDDPDVQNAVQVDEDAVRSMSRLKDLLQTSGKHLYNSRSGVYLTSRQIACLNHVKSLATRFSGFQSYSKRRKCFSTHPVQDKRLGDNQKAEHDCDIIRVSLCDLIGYSRPLRVCQAECSPPTFVLYPALNHRALPAALNGIDSSPRPGSLTCPVHACERFRPIEQVDGL